MAPVKPWTIALHCIHRNGLRVSAHRSRSPNSARRPDSSASSYRLRCGSMRTWQRNAMAWMVSPEDSSMRSRAVSWGSAAYGSAKMSRIENV